MFGFIGRIFSYITGSVEYLYYEADITVIRKRKVEVITAQFRKNKETGQIDIRVSNGWKPITQVFSGKSLPRIQRKAEKYADLAEQID